MDHDDAFDLVMEVASGAVEDFAEIAARIRVAPSDGLAEPERVDPPRCPPVGRVTLSARAPFAARRRRRHG